MSVRYNNLGRTLEDAALVKKLFETMPDRFLNVMAGIEQFFDLKSVAFDEVVGRLKAFEEGMKRGARSVTSNSSGQLLLTQVEWEAKYKGSRGGDSSERGDSESSRDLWYLDNGASYHMTGDLEMLETLDEEITGKVKFGDGSTVEIKEEIELDSDTEALLAVMEEPTCYKDAAGDENWEATMRSELQSISKNRTWELVYVSQPKGFEVKGKEKHVLKLSKALYGLRQAPRAWNIKLDKSLRFTKCASEPAAYTRGIGKDAVVLVDQQQDFIAIKQSSYARKILNQFGVGDCNPTKIPMIPRIKLHQDKGGKPVNGTEYRKMIGCLRYLLHIRPNLAYSVGMASRFMEKPTVMHLQAVKQILRYLKGTVDMGLVYTQAGGEEVLVGYTDSDLSGDLVGRRSTGAGGNRYFMLLIDDYTRWSYVYVLKTKDQALDAFVKFKAEAENVTGEKIKTLRSDRGGEFIAGTFNEVCERAGIQRHFTAPYSPQQNGVVERKNRTVMEMARSLLKSMNVPGKLWGEAVRHSVYLLNRLPTKAMSEKTPFEVWWGRKPNLGYLKVFGCTAHVRTAVLI
ncbi:uncharacterized protein [Miscanthus floridulus]|uniref:uncharacterized protein n=1 Tax=Miscanthus floridulus TaxID=154761 RepID=UPI0034583FF4